MKESANNFEYLLQIIDRLQSSLNDTIVNKYGSSDYEKVTLAWNTLGQKVSCDGGDVDLC